MKVTIDCPYQTLGEPVPASYQEAQVDGLACMDCCTIIGEGQLYHRLAANNDDWMPICLECGKSYL